MNGLKLIAEGRVGGYLVVWGSPAQKDLQGEYFTPQTELGLDWYAQRPVLYHHGLDGNMQATVIGVIDTLKMDDTGLWAEAQLDMRKRYVQTVQKLVERGILGWSSGSLPHLAEVTDDGWIKRWPIVEGSLTPTPAEPRRTDVHTIKSAYAEMSLDTARLELDETTAITPIPDGQTISLKELCAKAAIEIEPEEEDVAVTGISSSEEAGQEAEPPPAPPPISEPTEEKPIMEIRDILAAILANLGIQLSPEEQAAAIETVMQQMQGGDKMAEIETAAKAADFNKVMELLGPAAMAELGKVNAVREQRQGALQTAAKSWAQQRLGEGGFPTAPGFRAPQTPATPRIQIRSKYADLSAEDMSYLYGIHNARSFIKNRRPWSPDNEFVGELVTKAHKAYDAGKIRFGDEKEEAKAIKSLDMAIKSDELNYSTLASAGDEWVPDLWASQIWEQFRLDNVVAPLLSIVEMPSNPFELPIESTDPTVYFVPETKNEADLTLDAAGNPTPDSKMTTGKVTLTAKKLSLRVGFSTELEEDSIIPFAAQLRQQAQRALEDAIDHVLLNGDDSASGNINLDGGTPGATVKYMAFEGIRHVPIIDNAANAIDAGNVAPTLAAIRTARFAMPAARATRPQDIAYITHGEVYAKLLGLNEFLTMERAGANATAQTGQIGFIDGSPVLVTNELGLTATNGKINNSGGSNTRGSLVVVHRPSWTVGYRRRINVNLDFLAWADSYQLTATVRLALSKRDTEAASVLYNLNVS